MVEIDAEVEAEVEVGSWRKESRTSYQHINFMTQWWLRSSGFAVVTSQ